MFLENLMERIIKKTDFESARHSAGQVADALIKKWEEFGKQQAFAYAKERGWTGDFYVTSIVRQYRATPKQYMRLMKTKIIPPPNTPITVMIPRDIITKTNVWPLENSIKRKLNVEKLTEEVLYIVPRNGRGEEYAPGQPLENSVLYKGYLAYKNFLATNPDVHKNLEDEIEAMKKLAEE